MEDLNDFFFFYYYFYKRILDEDYPNLLPQRKVKMAGELWGLLPNYLKRSVIIFSKNNKLLRNWSSLQMLQKNFIHQRNDEPVMIFDKYCQINAQNENVEDRLFKDMFEKFINKDAYED